MNKGTKYELLNKEIFEIIFSQSDIKDINIQHNIFLKGKSTIHQIDVYWEFELGGIIYKTVVQTKNWDKPVDKGELLKFRAVLEDLPGQPRGIFVTRSGYQSGANAVAEANGIELLELEEIDDKPLKIKAYGFANCHLIPTSVLGVETAEKSITFIMDCITYEPEIDDLIIKLDNNWFSNKLQLSVDKAKAKISKIQLPTKQPIEYKFYDDKENVINDLDKIYKQFIEKLKREGGKQQKMCHLFDEPTFVQVNDFEIKFLKVLSISGNVKIKESKAIKKYMKFPDIVQFRLRNLNKNTEKIVGKKKP